MNLTGCRAIEWSWVVTRLPQGPGRALDFGCAHSDLGVVAARRGFAVTAVDLKPVTWPYDCPGLEFMRGDLLELDLGPESFDLVINCSTVEHVGLSGRYGSDERPDGDLEAMQHLLGLTKPGGTMVLTIPVGHDMVVRPLHRIYGRERLPRLLDGWEVEAKEFWVKDESNSWRPCAQGEALDFQSAGTVYGLGCFVLRRGLRSAQRPAEESDGYGDERNRTP